MIYTEVSDVVKPAVIKNTAVFLFLAYSTIQERVFHRFNRGGTSNFLIVTVMLFRLSFARPTKRFLLELFIQSLFDRVFE